MPDGFENAMRLLPTNLCCAAELLSLTEKKAAEEFRLRCGRTPAVLLPSGERLLAGEKVTAADLLSVLEQASESSLHSVGNELRQGYLTAQGGVRIGICGTAVMDGSIRTLRDISSLSIRIPRQVRGAGKDAVGLLNDCSVLILSPPGGGKTTFLRELVRTVSDAGVRVGLADERNELAAVFGGEPQFDVGRCTDILTGAPKAEAAMLLLRAMNPQVIAMDEISAPADAAAILQAAGCGVRIFATAHAASADELQQRPLYRELLNMRLFQKAVLICSGAERSYRVMTL